MARIVNWGLAGAACLLIVAAGQGSEPAKAAGAPEAGGDAFPRACVDCHRNFPERDLDVRISTLASRWQQGVRPATLERAQLAAPAGVKLQGKHPAIKVGAVPAGCETCHTKTATKTPPFARLVHALHLLGGEQNEFVSHFGGSCTHCHKLDPATAAWSVPSATEESATVAER